MFYINENFIILYFTIVLLVDIGLIFLVVLKTERFDNIYLN